MTLFLIDINVWLALTWEFHSAHRAATKWFTAQQRCTYVFCRTTMLGLLRLLTNRLVMGDSVLTIDQALSVYEQWLDDPRVEFAAEPHGIEVAFRKALSRFGKESATKAVADSYLAGFAAASGAQVVTFDKGLALTARSHSVPVALLKK